MNPIDQAIIQADVLKVLEQSGRVGRTTKTVLDFNGDTSGIVVEDDLVFISTEVYDLTKLERVVYTTNTGAKTIVEKENIIVIDMDGNGQVAQTSDGTYVAVAQYGFGTGVYCTDALWVSRLEFAKTIHPIDPKFLPPVDSITMNGADGKQYKLTVSGGALNIAEVV